MRWSCRFGFHMWTVWTEEPHSWGGDPYLRLTSRCIHCNQNRNYSKSHNSKMTRINLVPPEELMDQHLFAEFREIKMIPKALARSLKNHTVDEVLKKVPPKFCLGKGHVSFFYNKGTYLEFRYYSIRRELRRRGIKFNEKSEFDPDGVFRRVSTYLDLNNTYTPTDDDLALIRARIAEKIAMKPSWYRKTSY